MSFYDEESARIEDIYRNDISKLNYHFQVTQYQRKIHL